MSPLFQSMEALSPPKTIGYTAVSGGSFVGPIMAALAGRYESKLIKAWPDDEVDLLWLEFCDQTAVDILKRRAKVPTLVRLHSFEAFTPFPARVHWADVDALVFVAEHVREQVMNSFEGPWPDAICTIPNALDLSHFALLTAH